MPVQDDQTSGTPYRQRSHQRWIDLDGAVTLENRTTHFPLDRSLRVKHAVAIGLPALRS